MFLVRVGSEFQAAGPATANEPSAKCVLVRRTVKTPRTTVLMIGEAVVVARAAQVSQVPGRRSVENVEHQNA